MYVYTHPAPWTNAPSICPMSSAGLMEEPRSTRMSALNKKTQKGGLKVLCSY